MKDKPGTAALLLSVAYLALVGCQADTTTPSGSTSVRVDTDAAEVRHRVTKVVDTTAEEAAFVAQKNFIYETLDDKALIELDAAIKLSNRALEAATSGYQLRVCGESELAAGLPQNVVAVVPIGRANVFGGADLFTYGSPRLVFLNWSAFEASYKSELQFLAKNRGPALDSLEAQLDRLPSSQGESSPIRQMRIELSTWRKLVPSQRMLLFLGLLHELGHIDAGHSGPAGLFHHVAEGDFGELPDTYDEDGDGPTMKGQEREADRFAARVVTAAANSGDDELGNLTADAFNALFLLGRVEAFRITSDVMGGDRLKILDTTSLHEVRTLRLLRMYQEILQVLLSSNPERQDLGNQLKALKQAIEMIEDRRKEHTRLRRAANKAAKE